MGVPELFSSFFLLFGRRHPSSETTCWGARQGGAVPPMPRAQGILNSPVPGWRRGLNVGILGVLLRVGTLQETPNKHDIDARRDFIQEPEDLA